MPTTATPRTGTPTDADGPALTADAIDGAPARTWAAELADVPTTIAWRAAVKKGATLVERGTCGETGHAWFHDYPRDENGNRVGGAEAAPVWWHDNGYEVTTVADEMTIAVDGGGNPRQLEVLSWRDNDHRAAQLNTWLDLQAERRYLELAVLAARRGQAEAFTAAVDALVAADPYALDAGLVARLTGRDLGDVTADGEDSGPEDDEDLLSGR